jgi:Set1/Ash2 histone methyltransferase complex subunit ASH2
MSVRDSAPQLNLDDGMTSSHSDLTFDDGIDFSKTIRRLVVRGGMRGYRMSRASHGVSSGCYYYEAVVLSSKSGAVGTKRQREEDGQDLETENSESSNANKDMGHLRIGWSTRLGDLQAPVGYDKYSYAVRDIMGSRVHNSRREDKWGGLAFGPGDVIGFVICLNENKHIVPSSDPAAAAAAAAAGGGGNEQSAIQTSHIRVYKNGVLMGSQLLLDEEKKSPGIAFDNIPADTYFPAVSCYLNGAAQLNFGPHFVYPPAMLPTGQVPRPVSEMCPSPPTPEEAEETVISSSKEGRKIFLSKRTDEGIVAAFKQLVRTEANVRRQAYTRHLLMHRIEIQTLRNERGLSTADLLHEQS